MKQWRVSVWEAEHSDEKVVSHWQALKAYTAIHRELVYGLARHLQPPYSVSVSQEPLKGKGSKYKPVEEGSS